MTDVYIDFSVCERARAREKKQQMIVTDLCGVFPRREAKKEKGEYKPVLFFFKTRSIAIS